MSSRFDGSLLIVGNGGDVHVGHHFERAAKDLAIPTTLCNVDSAYAAPRVIRAFNWRLRGRRPARLQRFSGHVLDACRRLRPTCLIATGLAPIEAAVLREIGRHGVTRVNFLTDDPWSPFQRAPWFMDGLPEYDFVFSPRMANLDDLRNAGCRRVSYLPFGYAPEIHFPEPPSTEGERERFASDLVFAGGADDERFRWIEAFLSAGFSVAVYGGYWDRYPKARRAARGMADAQVVRKAIGGAAVALCLVRRSNRDGQSMRTFEVPAIGACMLVEDTAEHRALFGAPGAAVAYATTPEEGCQQLRWLLDHDTERGRLRQEAHALITTGGHSYRDRLMDMLKTVDDSHA